MNTPTPHTDYAKMEARAERAEADAAAYLKRAESFSKLADEAEAELATEREKSERYRLATLRLDAELATEREKCDKLLSVLIHADQILDDIDTCSDAHKPMYSSYSQNVFKLCIKGRDARRDVIDAAMKEDAK